MAILVTLDMMLAQRKMSLTELSKEVGITITNLSILKTGKAKGVSFSTLDQICKALKCEPGDVLKFMDDDEYKQLMRE